MAKKLLVALKPPKPISEMSDEERDAFADKVFDAAAAKHETEPAPADDNSA